MNEIVRARVTAEVGLGLYGQVREAVQMLRWKGYEIECTEGSGWFSRTFYFKGDLVAIELLQKLFKGYE